MAVAQIIYFSVFWAAVFAKSQCLSDASLDDCDDESVLMALRPAASSILKELQAQNAELKNRLSMLELENQELKRLRKPRAPSHRGGVDHGFGRGDKQNKEPANVVAMDFTEDGNVLYKDSTKQPAPQALKHILARGAVAEAFWQGSPFGAFNTKLGPPPMLRVAFAASLFKSPHAFATSTLMVIINGSVQVTAKGVDATRVASEGSVVWIKAGALWNAAGDATCMIMTFFESLTTEMPSSSFCYDDAPYTKSPILSVAKFPDDDKTGSTWIWPFADNTNHAILSEFSPVVNDSETVNVVFIRNCPGCEGSDDATSCMGCTSQECEDWTDLHFHPNGILYIPVHCPANTYTACSAREDVFVFSDNYTTKEINCQMTVGEARYMMPQRVYTERPSRCAIAINGDLSPVVDSVVDGLTTFSSNNAEVCLENAGRYTTRLWHNDYAKAPKNKTFYYMS